MWVVAFFLSTLANVIYLSIMSLMKEFCSVTEWKKKKTRRETVRLFKDLFENIDCIQWEIIIRRFTFLGFYYKNIINQSNESKSKVHTNKFYTLVANAVKYMCAMIKLQHQLWYRFYDENDILT